jgi:hypothetical protein
MQNKEQTPLEETLNPWIEAAKKAKHKTPDPRSATKLEGILKRYTKFAQGETYYIGKPTKGLK